MIINKIRKKHLEEKKVGLKLQKASIFDFIKSFLITIGYSIL